MTTLPPSLRGTYHLREVGAGNRVRTGDLNLGKVALYQLSYSRIPETRYSIACGTIVNKKHRKITQATELNGIIAALYHSPGGFHVHNH